MASQRKEHTAKKVHSMGFNAVTDNTGLTSFIQLLLPPKCAKSSEILRKIQTHSTNSSSRSSILV